MLTLLILLDIKVKRRDAARYNLSPEDVLDMIQASIGGINVTTAY
ncbi:MAG TPA: hypothetical protein VLH56_02055 [Dissulfurispiraceae bacterium]|nr:hypothetical protein [Dissulfurispiraceae bacterium]